MSEPKYKVNDWVLIYKDDPLNIRVSKIREVKYVTEEMSPYHRNMYGYYYVTTSGAFYQDYIESELVKIIPITDKPFCIDCKNGYDEEHDKLFDTCPVVSWADSNGRVDYTELRNDTQPPDNCYCFVPKESK